MKIISSKVHGILDYLVAILFIVIPFANAWDTSRLPSTVFFVLGILTLFYSLGTDYETGAVRVIPFRVHLAIDLVSGLFLATSPWLLGFANEAYLPHLAFGIFEIAVVMFTRKDKSVTNTTTQKT